MIKKLLLTVALLSSAYGSEIEYFDPDFSQLANRNETLEVNEKGVVINPEKPEPSVLRRLTQAEVSDTVNSEDLNVLYHALADYNEDISSIQMIYITLTADSTPNNGYSTDQDAEFLRRLFWSRIGLSEQILKVMLDLPLMTEGDSKEILIRDQRTISVLSKKYDHTDTTPFTKGHYKELKQLMDEFNETSNVQQTVSSMDE